MEKRHLTYWQIAGDLQDRIKGGEYPRRSQLPSYSGLSEEYNVSLSTVKRAVLLLRERDVVRGIPGRGVFVR